MNAITDLRHATANVGAVKHPTRVGVSLAMGESPVTRISPLWSMGGWNLQFVRLPAGGSLRPDHGAGEVFLKVILGGLASPPRVAYPPVGAVVSTRLTADTVTASAQGALCAIFTRTVAAPAEIERMSQLVISGPLAQDLGWQTFEQRYSAVTPFFKGADAHLVPGFHLLDALDPGTGEEIAYVFFWTAGKGVDLSTHNHGHTPSATGPAFAEVHQVLYNGTGSGGMYSTPEPGAAERTRLPMQRGEEHGPFFAITADGRAKLRANGAVEYPWHGWQAGQDNRPGQAYDLVCAYEITAPYALVR